MNVDEILDAHTDGTLTADALFALCEDYRRLQAIERAAKTLYRRSGDTGPALVAFDAEIERIERS